MESEQDNKLIKELRALGKVEAPHDFLYRVNSRLEEKPKKVVFPYKLATAGAAFLLIFSIYVLMQPEYRMAFMAPEAKVEKKEASGGAARREAVSKRISKVTAPAKPEARPAAEPEAEMPAEMALILDAEEYNAMMGAGAAPAAPIMDVAAEPPKPSSFDKVQYIVSLVDGKVVDSSSEYIIAEIPTAKQESFLTMIGQFDEVEKPAPILTNQETVRLQIKLLQKN